MSKKICKFIKKNNLRIIHVHDMVIAKAIFNLKKKFHLKIILDLHENRPEIMKYYPHLRSRMKRLLINLKAWKKNQDKLIKLADRVVVVTEEAKEDIKHLKNKEDIIVVPNTIDLNIFGKYEINTTIIEKYKNHFAILYVGDTSIRRGTDTAIKAVEILKDEIKNIKLVLVGRSRKDDILLKELVRKIGVKEFVDFEGWQDMKLFPSYIKASQICISPLKRNKHHDTTYANKLFQYMSYGKPVLVSDCPSQEKIVEENKCGFVFKANDPKDFAKKILELHSDSLLRNEMGKKGRQAVLSKYNWDLTKNNLLKMYNKLN